MAVVFHLRVRGQSPGRVSVFRRGHSPHLGPRILGACAHLLRARYIPKIPGSNDLASRSSDVGNLPHTSVGHRTHYRGNHQNNLGISLPVRVEYSKLWHSWHYFPARVSRCGFFYHQELGMLGLFAHQDLQDQGLLGNVIDHSLISTLPIFIISTLWWDYAFFPLLDSIGVIFTALISILMAFFVMFFLIFFPLTALLGGWDEYMFYIFKKAVDISGPSKGLLKMIQWEMEQCIKASRKLRLHGRWSIPHEDADKEIRALMVMKKNGTLVAAPKK